MQRILSKVQINRIVKYVDFKGREQKNLPLNIANQSPCADTLPPVLLPCLYYRFVS